MKKAYHAPALVESGHIVVETRGPGSNSGDTPNGLSAAPGSVGFNL
jgi:hypothetical protein